MTLEARVAALEAEVAQLRQALDDGAEPRGGVLEANHQRFLAKVRERELVGARRRANEGGAA